jgi:hypothetical protein
MLSTHIGGLGRVRGRQSRSAVVNRRKRVVERLLDAGAGVNKPDNDGHSAIWRAHEKQYVGIEKILMDHGKHSMFVRKVLKIFGHEAPPGIEYCIECVVPLFFPLRTRINIHSHN